MKNAMLCGLRGIEIEMPEEAIRDCSASGPVDDAVEYWGRKIPAPSILTRELQITILAETGGWPRAELEAIEWADELWGRCLWIAACNYKEENREEFD